MISLDEITLTVGDNLAEVAAFVESSSGLPSVGCGRNGSSRSWRTPAGNCFFAKKIPIDKSHSGADTDAAKSLASLLRQGSVDVWLDVEHLAPGDVWMDQLEAALITAKHSIVYVGPSGVRNWVGREVRFALDRSTRDRSFRLVPVLGPGADAEALQLFLKQHQWLDLKVKKSALDRFLAVVGDSGSGKSSLVKAGLIPALHGGRLALATGETASWRVCVARSGDPFRELAEGLAQLDSGDLQVVFGDLMNRSASAHRSPSADLEYDYLRRDVFISSEHTKFHLLLDGLNFITESFPPAWP